MKKEKSSDMANFVTIMCMATGMFGVIALFVSMMTRIDESPAFALLGGFLLMVLAVGAHHFFRRKVREDAGDIADAPEVGRLADRLENLEALICRLDRELNHQIEQSLFSSGRQQATGISQMPTSMLNVATALEERFQMLRDLGHGGMGVVIQAYDKQLKEQVAIKVLSPVLSCNQEALERLRREVSAARRVTHPNVIRIHDIAETNGLSYVSMEYFEGVNLKEFMRAHESISNAVCIQIAMQICDGLEAAHKQGVIHRDLKPQNIIINKAHQIKIIDFGLARSKHLEGMTATGLIMGTPEYMAPEQVAGKEVDERADLYALGIILYELFTGSVPFSGESAISIGFQQVRDDPPAPRTRNPKLSEELEAVILKALQKNRSDRYSSCSELRLGLEKALQLPFQAASAKELNEKPAVQVGSADFSRH